MQLLAKVNSHLGWWLLGCLEVAYLNLSSRYGAHLRRVLAMLITQSCIDAAKLLLRPQWPPPYDGVSL